MSLLAQSSVVKSFKLNHKRIRVFYIKDVGQCLISQDVYTAVGYGRECGVKAMQQKVKNVIGGHRDRHERGGCPPSLKHGFID